MALSAKLRTFIAKTPSALAGPPFFVEALDIYTPGQEAGEVYVAGSEAGEVSS